MNNRTIILVLQTRVSLVVDVKVLVSVGHDPGHVTKQLHPHVFGGFIPAPVIKQRQRKSQIDRY